MLIKKLAILLCFISSLTAKSQLIKIEAESFTASRGVQTEITKDVGGGLNMSYIENGDWAEYTTLPVGHVIMEISFRFANPKSDSARIQITQADGKVLAIVPLPITGGFQTWKTISTKIPITETGQKIRLNFMNKTNYGINLNWFSYNLFSLVAPSYTTTPAPAPSTTVMSDTLLNQKVDDLKNTLLSLVSGLSARLSAMDSAMPVAASLSSRMLSVDSIINSIIGEVAKKEDKMPWTWLGSSFIGKGTDSLNALEMGVRPVTQAKRLEIKPSVPLIPQIVYQTDGVKGYYVMKEEGWVFLK